MCDIAVQNNKLNTVPRESILRHPGFGQALYMYGQIER